MVKNTDLPKGKEFETRGDRVAKRAAKKALDDRHIIFGLVASEDAYEDHDKDEDLIKKYGGTNAMKSKSFATKRYMNGGMVMSGRGVRDTKMS
tara:strand:- start:2189 stop:2467 length:279 start_codon:yes stop_codon:yes gene_type:complete